MSYILDALKKSDQDRKKGQVPDLNTVQEEAPQEDRKKPLWPYFLGGILLVNAAVFGSMIYQKNTAEKPLGDPTPHLSEPIADLEKKTPEIQSQQTAVLAQKVSENHSISVVEADIDSKNVVPIERPVSSVEKLPAIDTEKLVVDEKPDSVEIAPITIADAGSETIQTAAIAESPDNIFTDTKDNVQNIDEGAPAFQNIIEPEDDKVISDAEDLEGQPSPAEHPVNIAKFETSKEPTAPTSESLTEKRKEQKIQRQPLHFMQLPAAIQQNLPDIRISAHVYFEKKPSSRLASINGKIVREGYTLAPDLKVEEITSDGVIFSYKNYLFHVPTI